MSTPGVKLKQLAPACRSHRLGDNGDGGGSGGDGAKGGWGGVGMGEGGNGVGS